MQRCAARARSAAATAGHSGRAQARLGTAAARRDHSAHSTACACSAPPAGSSPARRGGCRWRSAVPCRQGERGAAQGWRLEPRPASAGHPALPHLWPRVHSRPPRREPPSGIPTRDPHLEPPPGVPTWKPPNRDRRRPTRSAPTSAATASTTSRANLSRAGGGTRGGAHARGWREGGGDREAAQHRPPAASTQPDGACGERAAGRARPGRQGSGPVRPRTAPARRTHQGRAGHAFPLPPPPGVTSPSTTTAAPCQPLTSRPAPRTPTCSGSQCCRRTGQCGGWPRT